MCLRGVFWRWMAMNRAQVAAIERGLCGSLPQRRAAAASDAGLCRHQTPRADHVVGESVPQRDGLDLVHAAHKKLHAAWLPWHAAAQAVLPPRSDVAASGPGSDDAFHRRHG